MQIIKKLDNINSFAPSAVTIGNFDGVHLGHLQILQNLLDYSKKQNLSPTIVTFDPHPIFYFNKNATKDYQIMSLTQKLLEFEKLGFENVIILKFDKYLAEISAEDFVNKILIEKLNLKYLSIGYDFTFGAKRKGNYDLLEKFSKSKNFILHKTEKFTAFDKIASSTNIRELIKKGDVALAAKFLNKNFQISGIVNKGKQLGSKIGFPTINMKPDPLLIKPKFGVYKSKTIIPHLNQEFPSITNFGQKPTIDDNLEAVFETHIPNFSENLYGKMLKVELTDFIRDEKKFDSIDSLKQQITADIKKIDL